MIAEKKTVAPDELVVSCGSLTIDLDEKGRGNITIDGVLQRVTDLVLRVKAGERPTVTLTRFVDSPNGKGD